MPPRDWTSGGSGPSRKGKRPLETGHGSKWSKNKIAPPFKQAEFDIIYGRGISKEADILDLGASLDIVDKSGAWYSFKDERIGQGRQNVRRFLEENTDIRDQIADLIKEKTGIKKDVQPPAEEPVEKKKK